MTITLREKPRKDGGARLYLDIYVKGYKRKCEFLSLTLIRESTAADRETNRRTRIQAEVIRARRLLELQASVNGLQQPGDNKATFLSYFEKLTEERFNINVDHTSWVSTLRHLKLYIGTSTLPLRAVDALWLEQFKKYLLHKAQKPNGEKIARNTAHHYFNRVLHSLKQAYKEKKIAVNPTEHVDYIEKADTKKEFLSFEEIQLLLDTKCRYEVLKNAFLFCCFSAMRHSDVLKLTWSEIRYSEANGWEVYFTHAKTDTVQLLPITEQARKFLPAKPGRPSELVFQGLKYSAHYNDELLKWCRRAGINKHITFHCSRATAATLWLTSGVDIYSVSKLLGHSDLKTTEVYLTLVNSKRIEAVNKVPLLKF